MLQLIRLRIYVKRHWLWVLATSMLSSFLTFEFVYNHPGSDTRNALLHNVNLMGAHGSDFTLNRL